MGVTNFGRTAFSYGLRFITGQSYVPPSRRHCWNYFCGLKF